MEDKFWVETCCDKFGRQKVSHKHYFLLKSHVLDRLCATLQRPLLSILLLHKLATLPVWQTEFKNQLIHFPELFNHLINPDWDMDQERHVIHSDCFSPGISVTNTPEGEHVAPPAVCRVSTPKPDVGLTCRDTPMFHIKSVSRNIPIRPTRVLWGNGD